VTHPGWPFGRFADGPEFGLLGGLMGADSEEIRIEEFVEGDRFVVRAEVPGVDPEKNIDVSITGGALHIHVTREERVEHSDDGRYRTEFQYGSFARTVPLPPGTYESEVKATYDDGVLEIRLPIAKAISRRVEVKHA
jgi:HSP20 family protein